MLISGTIDASLVTAPVLGGEIAEAPRRGLDSSDGRLDRSECARGNFFKTGLNPRAPGCDQAPLRIVFPIVD